MISILHSSLDNSVKNCFFVPCSLFIWAHCVTLERNECCCTCLELPTLRRIRTKYSDGIDSIMIAKTLYATSDITVHKVHNHGFHAIIPTDTRPFSPSLCHSQGFIADRVPRGLPVGLTQPTSRQSMLLAFQRVQRRLRSAANSRSHCSSSTTARIHSVQRLLQSKDQHVHGQRLIMRGSQPAWFLQWRMVVLAHGQRNITLESHSPVERWPPVNTLLLSSARTACTAGVAAQTLRRLVQVDLGTACIAGLILDGTANASPLSP